MTLRQFSIRELIYKKSLHQASCLCLVVAACLNPVRAAETWKILVPTAAQGSTDVLTRALAKTLSADLGEVVEVLNVPGLSGTKAANTVYAAAADTKTLMMATVSSHAIAFGLTPSPNYSADGFTPIAMIGAAPYLLMVSPTSPHTEAKSLFEAARRSPLAYSSTGVNGPHHLVAELMAQRVQVQMKHQPYGGGADALQALANGMVDLMLPASILALPKIQDGSLRVLATTGSQRSQTLPQVPTLSESGLPGFSAESWYVLLGPPKMPAASIERLEKAVVRALQDPAYLKLMQSNGVEARPMGRAQVNAFLLAESQKWGSLVQQLNAPAAVASGPCQQALAQWQSAQQWALTSRDALITTRRQAQDFKNVLLRFWSDQSRVMQSRLADRVQDLKSLAQSLEQLNQVTGQHAQIVGVITLEITKVSKTYEAAIQQLEPGNAMSVFKADEHAKGIDVPMFRALEQLVALTTTQMQQQRNQVLAQCH